MALDISLRETNTILFRTKNMVKKTLMKVAAPFMRAPRNIFYIFCKHNLIRAIMFVICYTIIINIIKRGSLEDPNENKNLLEIF